VTDRRQTTSMFKAPPPVRGRSQFSSLIVIVVIVVDFYQIHKYSDNKLTFFVSTQSVFNVL